MLLAHHTDHKFGDAEVHIKVTISFPRMTLILCRPNMGVKLTTTSTIISHWIVLKRWDIKSATILLIFGLIGNKNKGLFTDSTRYTNHVSNQKSKEPNICTVKLLYINNCQNSEINHWNVCYMCACELPFIRNTQSVNYTACTVGDGKSYNPYLLFTCAW